MSDTAMYCHACHHQWQRQTDAIECPACRSASTEIVSPENDPRHFHDRVAPETAPAEARADAAATSASSPDQQMPDAPQDSQDPANGNNNTNSDQNAGTTGNNSSNGPNTSATPRPEFVIMFPPPAVTFFTTVVTDHVPPPGAAGPRGPPVVHFGVNFFNPLPHIIPVSPSATEANTSTPQGQQQPQQEPVQQPAQQQQNTPPSGPHPAAAGPSVNVPLGFLGVLLSSMFNPNPANAVLGDAVFSQEALDRIISQIREQQSGPVGAPPASQAAIDKLEVRELDEKMTGGETTTKCVICVDDMAVGEKASVLPCSHFFHGECVTPWLKQHNTCPVCRRPIEETPLTPAKAAEFSQEQAPSQAPTEAAGPTGCL